MHKILTTILLLTAYLTCTAQYDIDFKLKNYDNDTIIIGNYYADKTLVKDTLYSQGKGHFKMQGTDELNEGVYLILLQPTNDFAQFVVNADEKNFSIKWDTSDPNALEAKGSKDNAALYDYLKYLSSVRPEADALRAQINEAENAETNSDARSPSTRALKTKCSSKSIHTISSTTLTTYNWITQLHCGHRSCMTGWTTIWIS